MNRGGKRKGAGRKPAPAGTAKVPYGTKLDPQVVEYLRQCENAAETLETVVKRSKAYRDWKAKQCLSGEKKCECGKPSEINWRAKRYVGCCKECMPF